MRITKTKTTVREMRITPGHGKSSWDVGDLAELVGILDSQEWASDAVVVFDGHLCTITETVKS